MVAALRLSCLLLSVLYMISMVSAMKTKHVAPGMSPEMFPSQTFDESLAVCHSNEPCGYYAFSLHDRTKVHWVQSWCRCGGAQQCVFGYTDMRMHVYKHFCVDNNKLS